jgi:hypothetical protein
MVALKQYCSSGLITLMTLCVGCAPNIPLLMKAENMRAAIDECRQRELNVLLYKRPDNSAFAIRCIPKNDDVDKTVIVRPRMPVNALRPFLKQEIMVVEDHE